MYAPELDPPAPERVALAPALDAGGAPENREAAFVTALIAGDPPTWRVFYESYSPVLLDAIRAVRSRFPGLIGDEDVRDIHADLCLQLFGGERRRLRQFDASRGTPLAAWLVVLARHAAFDFLRQRRRQPTVRWKGEESTHREALATDAPDAFSVCASRERAALVARLVDELSERDRQFVEVYFYEGLDPEQTAERLGICVGTVYSKKHKIRARIESLLGKRLAA